jgi:hypothetical protein
VQAAQFLVDVETVELAAEPFKSAVYVTNDDDQWDTPQGQALLDMILAAPQTLHASACELSSYGLGALPSMLLEATLAARAASNKHRSGERCTLFLDGECLSTRALLPSIAAALGKIKHLEALVIEPPQGTGSVYSKGLPPMLPGDEVLCALTPTIAALAELEKICELTLKKCETKEATLVTLLNALPRSVDKIMLQNVEYDALSYDEKAYGMLRDDHFDDEEGASAAAAVEAAAAASRGTLITAMLAFRALQTLEITSEKSITVRR